MKKRLLAGMALILIISVYGTQTAYIQDGMLNQPGTFITYDTTVLQLITDSAGNKFAISIINASDSKPKSMWMQYTLWDKDYRIVVDKHIDATYNVLIGPGLMLLKLKAGTMKEEVAIKREMKVQLTDDLAIGFNPDKDFNNLPYLCYKDQVMIKNISWDEIVELQEMMLSFTLGK